MMRNSIRFNLFILFVSLMAGFVVLGLLFNIFVMEKYYILKNKESFQAIAGEVNKLLPNEKTLKESIEELDRAEGASIIIADKNYNYLFTSISQTKDNSRLPKEIEELIKNNQEKLKTKPIYEIVEKSQSQPKLVYLEITEDEKYLVISKPIKGIRESAAIANQFYFITAIISILCGGIFMFRFSDKVTRPIVEMSEITEDISRLNFERKLKVKSKNELGNLAESINMLSDKLKDSIDSLKGDIAFQKALSRNMSHELKTPIGIIKGYSEGLLFGVADNPEKIKEYLKIITAECDRMDELVTEILTLSRISAENYILTNIKEFPAKRILEEVEERLSNIAESQGVELITIADDRIMVSGNYELLYRSINNLVLNAIKYCSLEKKVEIKAVEMEYEILFKVFNTGLGIPVDEIPKIFDEFYKVEKARSRDFGGYGLGLAIVRSIADLHGGSVEAANVSGGIEFIFSIPKKLH